MSVEKITNNTANSIHLYFTGKTVTADGRFTVYLDDELGVYNVKCRVNSSGEVFQVTHATSQLVSYVFPNGGNKGLSFVSVTLDAENSLLYWIENNRLNKYCLNTRSNFTLQYSVEISGVSAYMTVSEDGSRLCLTDTNSKAFKETDKSQHEQLAKVPNRMYENNLYTDMMLVDTATGEIVQRVDVPFWVTHVQFMPGQNETVLFNSEGVKFPVGTEFWKRLWITHFDGTFKSVPKQSETRRINHENFIPKLGTIVYHGKVLKQKRNFIVFNCLRVLSRLGVDVKKPLEKFFEHFIEAIDLNGDVQFTHYVKQSVSHAISVDSEATVFDSRDGNIYKLSNSTGEVSCLCEHGSSFSSQIAHPHPNPSQQGQYLVYCSDKDGKCGLFKAAL
jgi:hypothetical protein